MGKVVSLVNENGVVYATSRQIASDFEKDHKHVLDSIRETIKNLTAENSSVNYKDYFIEDTYVSRGKQYPQYKLTKDGFTLIGLGFNGAKALKFKIAYINEYNQMEQQLREIETVINTKGVLTEEDYANVNFSTAQRVKKTFINSQDIQKDYERFITYSRKSLDTKKRIKRLNQIIDTLKFREDELYRVKPKGYRSERENIIELTEEILRDINEINNRSYGQRLGHVYKKLS